MQCTALGRPVQQQLGTVLCCLQQLGQWHSLFHREIVAKCSGHQLQSAASVAVGQQAQPPRPHSSLCSSSSSSSGSCSCSSRRPLSTTSSNTIGTSAKTVESLQEIRARIFEHHIGDGRRSGRKAILRPLKGRHIASWYFTLTSPKMPMLEDEIEEERLLKVQLARATGSGPPKKGQGKRSGKKK